MSAAMIIALGGAAHAGGFERADQSVAVLFEKGRQLEFGAVYLIPEANGVASNLTPTPGQDSGDIAEESLNIRAAFKDDINESFSYAIILDQPYGANIAYPDSTYFARNSEAELTTYALTGILQYNLPESLGLAGGRFSVYGGGRLQYVDASANIPFLNGYDVSADSAISPGFLVGAAWERPELGMRVSLTYTSEIQSDLDTSESFTVGGNVVRSLDSTTSLDTPSSLFLEAQTGLNPKTLLYGSVRYVPWGDFEVTPPLYGQATGSALAFFADDRTTYRLGLGRKINDSWSVFGEVGFEESTGSPTTNITPTDGFLSGTLGVSYKVDRVRTTLGVRYADVGDADTILGGRTPAGQFTDSQLVAIGVRIGIDLN
jgi:long-subunit fatty acid transport protein